VKGIADRYSKGKKAELKDEELGRGSLFATGLVAGGALAGVVVALLSVNESFAAAISVVDLEHLLTSALGVTGYELLGALLFVVLGYILFKVAIGKEPSDIPK
jgi:hypothetical protein